VSRQRREKARTARHFQPATDGYESLRVATELSPTNGARFAYRWRSALPIRDLRRTGWRRIIRYSAVGTALVAHDSVQSSSAVGVACGVGCGIA
jgi:hypothetical protein